MYTNVLFQSVKTEPGTTGIDIILVARGPDVPDVPDVVSMNGVPFDPLVVRHAARSLLDRLNLLIAQLVIVQALVGTEVDVTSPLPPLASPPSPVPGMV